MRMRVQGLPTAALILLMAVGCAADEGDAASAGDDFNADAGGNSQDVGDFGGADVEADGLQEPEEEAELELTLPAASTRYLYVAERAAGRVARIDTETLRVWPIVVGAEPRIVVAGKDADRAIVLNYGSNTLSVITSDGADDDVVDVEIGPGANRVALAPGSTHALTWFDPDAMEFGDRPGSLQEVTVVDLAGAEAARISVGFHVRGVEFSTDGSVVWVVTDSGVSRVAMDTAAGDRIAIPTPLDDGRETADREIEIDADAAIALLRVAGDEWIRIVDLEDGAGVDVDLGGVPTDIDLVPGAALVAVRDNDMIARLPIPGVIDDPGLMQTLGIDGAPAGQVTLSANGSSALVFSTAGDQRTIAVVDVASFTEVGRLEVRKAIGLVAASPVDDVAIVVHADEAGAGGIDFVENSPGVSMLSIDAEYERLFLLAALPTGFAFTGDARQVFVQLGDITDPVRAVEQIDLATFAQETIPLPTRPIAIGWMPITGLVYVAQDSAAGRISFIEPESGNVEHVAGFGLNSWIE